MGWGLKSKVARLAFLRRAMVEHNRLPECKSSA